MSRPGRRIRLDLAYDGTRYSGWQVQPGRTTIQGTVEEALTRIQGGSAVRIRGAGRTDAGVHARHQVADASLETRLDDRELLDALSAILPDDVRPQRVATVSDDFHARREALKKTYRYTLDRSPRGDPFRSRFELHHPYALDRDALDRALGELSGRRDFAGFAGAASEVRETVRTLSEAGYAEPAPDRGVFTFSADGFLNHMVRNLVGTLLDVAAGRYGPERIVEILESRDRTRAGPTAPARGLCLDRVFYPGDPECESDLL